MILRYKGCWVKVNKEKWKSQNLDKKFDCIKEYFSEQVKYILLSAKDYWFGYVHVYPFYVTCGENESSHNELYEISIICGKHGYGQCFSHVNREMVEYLIRNWEISDAKKFHLHLELGGGLSQSYIFSKYQKDMLSEKLAPLLRMKWYEK